MIGSRWGRRVALAVALLSGPAVMAEAPAKVPLQVDVVTVSNRGADIEPQSLTRMQETFARQGLKFSSFRRLSSARLEVSAQPPTVLKLPNGRTVSLRLDRLEKDSAQVKLAIPGLLDETLVTLGKEGTVYQQAGSYQDGKLVLVLTPAR